ncbi:hypothetical protein PILCRDRAFT_366113 [Piloderma croceum F 1598]|uniref:Uncharacterized protein n=1 Tax=Piloderma croceum (strain F 1598) TaxID=765440 RepID=A0A0C3C736_PILCF|nr:hypothetical protein PILCRDRAFT_366113 [Piloderma croceum F 1598]
MASSNLKRLPINHPVCLILNHSPDGQSGHRITKRSVNYWPNRQDVGHPVPGHEGGYVDKESRWNQATRMCQEVSGTLQPTRHNISIIHSRLQARRATT